VIASALTVQDRAGVHRLEAVDEDLVAQQLDVALDAGARALKLGMLHRPAIVDAVRGSIAGRRIPVVLDPVLAATAGGALAEAGLLDALASLREHVAIVTPTLAEARLLLSDPGVDAAGAADALVASGWRAALVTGGDAEGSGSVDHLATDGGRIELAAPRAHGNPRGTGCALASLIAVGLARGLEMEAACRIAKGRITRAIAGAEDGLLSLRDEPVWGHAGHPFE
jgi:hydroxymethylpyrimidine/phosphomethylpyrimidine kinase